MATHSSILAWRIPCTEEPGGLQSMGSQRVRHDWVTNSFIEENWWTSLWLWVRQSEFRHASETMTHKLKIENLDSNKIKHSCPLKDRTNKIFKKLKWEKYLQILCQINDLYPYYVNKYHPRIIIQLD